MMISSSLADPDHKADNDFDVGVYDNEGENNHHHHILLWMDILKGVPNGESII